MELVPRWLIKQSVYRGGTRLDKRTLFVQPKPAIVTPPFGAGFHPSGKTKSFVVSIKERLVEECKPMDFEQWNYRFWQVEIFDGKPVTCVCRACEHCCFNKKDRRKHHDDAGCTKKIIGAFGLLSKDHKCVICDKICYTTRWGVPLCSNNECIESYCFDFARPQGLEDALRLLGHLT